MTTKILQLVNSSFFGIANPVTSTDQAVSFLGLDTLATLVLGHGVFSQYQGSRMSGFSIEALWSHSTQCAAMARIVAKQQNMNAKSVDEAFLGGMLQDVGKLVLVSEKTEDYAEILQRVGGQNGFADDVEREMLGATHGEVGAYLIGLWGLPDTVVEAVAFHETPSQCHGDDFGVLGVVHVASQLVLNPGATDPNNLPPHVDAEYLRKSGVFERWPVWQKACQQSMEEEEHAA